MQMETHLHIQLEELTLLFSVSSSGVVTFNAAPDYENPSDADANNVYDLMASVSDGSLSEF